MIHDQVCCDLPDIALQGEGERRRLVLFWQDQLWLQRKRQFAGDRDAHLRDFNSLALGYYIGTHTTFRISALEAGKRNSRPLVLSLLVMDTLSCFRATFPAMVWAQCVHMHTLAWLLIIKLGVNGVNN